MKLVQGKKYSLTDLTTIDKIVIDDAEYLGRKERKVGELVSHILVFKKGRELYGCDWAITRAEATETQPISFLEVLKKGKEVKNWK